MARGPAKPPATMSPTEAEIGHMAVAPADAFALADLLTSGLAGETLALALRERFATITRQEVFLACRIAASLRNADIVLLEAQLADVQHQLED
jgi:hypothetical protein